MTLVYLAKHHMSDKDYTEPYSEDFRVTPRYLLDIQCGT